MRAGVHLPGGSTGPERRGLRRRRDGPCRAHPATTEGFPASRASPAPHGEAGPPEPCSLTGLGSEGAAHSG